MSKIVAPVLPTGALMPQGIRYPFRKPRMQGDACEDERGRLGLNDTTGKKKPRKRSPPGLPAARRASCPIQRAQRGRQHALQVMPAESPVKQPSMAVEN